LLLLRRRQQQRLQLYLQLQLLLAALLLLLLLLLWWRLLVFCHSAQPWVEHGSCAQHSATSIAATAHHPQQLLPAAVIH
jgi:hypothetical protein